MRGYTHITYTKRLIIESLINKKVNKREIADIIGVHVSNLYRELERGKYTRLDGSTWIYHDAYSADIAERKYQENLRAKGGALKIGKDFALVEYIENKIVNEKYTPAAVLGEIKEIGLQFGTTICVNTLYSYIENGVFLHLTNKDLPLKSKKKKRKARQKQKKAPRGTSIEMRPQEITDRDSFGHWEMDCVCGSSKTVFLVLTERLTRREIIFKMSNQKAESVVRCLDKLEQRYKQLFSRIFKTITVDNGTEFSDFVGMEKSRYGEYKRTQIFYCHAYSAWERGTNERINREIRRLVPKGTNLSRYSNQDVKRIENWVNNYPRQVLGYKCSRVLFDEYLRSTA